MTTIACVLRSGGHYGPDWVWKMKRALQRHVDGPYQFRVLSDLPVFGIWGVPLLHRWPRWWSKLELFRPGALPAGRVLYLDLDTLPVAPIGELLAYAGPMAMLSDFYRPKVAQSGVMAFDANGVEARAIWRAFVASPDRAMRIRGDGEFIRKHVDAVRLQDLFPGKIVSLKVQARRTCPAGAALVCGHGVPRFDSAAAGWAHETWRAA